ncbi:MAG: YdcF family protein [Pseudomonadales bacterium]|nr:YdcF family protein [Candidatus Woesebacteria bacterium]MCB9800667.1 YdcF family protein [Pseudomonadales bacterium]
MQSRKHFSHLPNSHVLEEALEIEAKRTISTYDHFPRFDLFISWMKAININIDFFENQKHWQDLIAQGNELREQVALKTISAIKNKDTKLISILVDIENYLSEEHSIPKDIDILFVFGSKDIGRIQKAVNTIYKKNNVNKILITGGSRYDSQEKSESEAKVFREEAIKLGVPKEKIIIESESITIADNVRSGLNLLDTLNIEYKNIATMVSWFAQRRAWVHLKKYTNEVDIICVNSDPKSKELSPGEWYKYETGVNVIFSEFLKMKMAVMIDTA